MLSPSEARTGSASDAAFPPPPEDSEGFKGLTEADKQLLTESQEMVKARMESKSELKRISS